MEPIGALEQRYDIGRGLIFIRPVWDGSGPLFDEAEFFHLGDTVGGLKPEPNAQYNNLTVEELFGPAILKRYIKGFAPTMTMTVFPTPATLGIISPTGVASMGFERQRFVNEWTAWVVPENLFMKQDSNGFRRRVPVTWAGGAFLKDGVALTAEEQELADLSYVVWRADFEQLTEAMMDENGGYAGTEVNMNMQQQFIMPDGCQILLVMGELATFPTLDLEGFVS